MRNFVIFGILGLSFLVVASVQAAFVEVEGYGVVYDYIHMQYWLQPGPSSNGVFLNTLAILDILNCSDALNRSYGKAIPWETWRLAGFEDMQNLWTYEADTLADTFTGNPEGEYYAFGRYGDELPNDEHFIAGILIAGDTSYVLSSLPFSTISDNAEPRWLGAWIVADATQVPLPSTMILFFSGLSLLAFNKRKTLSPHKQSP